MNKLLTIALFATSTALHAQNVGIGTGNPTEKLTIDSGNVKIGTQVWNPSLSHLLRFGDYDFVHIGEVGDDSLEIQSRNVIVRTFSGYNANIDLWGSLHMTGSLTIADGSQGAGKILSGNANGTAGWAYPANYNSGFKVVKSSSQQVFSGSSYLLTYDQKNYDDANAFSGNAFTAPAAGLYHFDGKLLFNLVSSSYRYVIILQLLVNNNESSRTQHIIEAGVVADDSIELSLDQKLNAGDHVALYVYQNSSVTQTAIPQLGFFSGHRVY